MRCNEAAASSTTRLIAAVRMISRCDDGRGAATRDACGIEAACSGAAARFSARCELPQPNRSRQKALIQTRVPRTTRANRSGRFIAQDPPACRHRVLPEWSGHMGAPTPRSCKPATASSGCKQHGLILGSVNFRTSRNVRPYRCGRAVEVPGEVAEFRFSRICVDLDPTVASRLNGPCVLADLGTLSRLD